MTFLVVKDAMLITWPGLNQGPVLENGFKFDWFGRSRAK